MKAFVVHVLALLVLAVKVIAVACEHLPDFEQAQRITGSP
jgi:hypothetical protein